MSPHKTGCATNQDIHLGKTISPRVQFQLKLRFPAFLWRKPVYSFRQFLELLLAFLEHNGDSELLLPISARLCGEKTFMLQAVERNPLYMPKLSSNLVGDWDLLLAATGDPRSYKQPVFARGQWNTVVEVARKVRDRLCVHDTFVKTVLCGTRPSA